MEIHPNKHIQDALNYARDNGWIIKKRVRELTHGVLFNAKMGIEIAGCRYGQLHVTLKTMQRLFGVK